MKTSIVSLPAKEHLAMAGISKLPNEWEVIQVNKLLSEDRGISVGVMYPGDHDPNGIPLIKVTDLNGNSINHYPDFRISPEKHFEYRRTELEGGEILLTLVGGLGQCAIVPHSMAGWNTARAVAVIRLKESRDASYLRYCLLSPPLQYLIHAWANTTVQATINLKEIRQLPIPWPQFTERTTIAAILGSLDDKIELNRQMNRTLEAMAQALFKSWFVDFDPVRAKAEGRETGLPEDVAALFPDRLVESELGEIPEGWQPKSLKEITSKIGSGATPRGGSAIYVEEGVNLIRSQNVYDSDFSWEGLAKITGDEARKLESVTVLRNDVLINITGDSILRTCVADQSVLPARVNQHVSIVRPQSDIPPHFIHQHLLRPETKNNLLNMSSGATRKAITKGHLEAACFITPMPELLAAFQNITDPLFERVSLNREQSRTLAALRDTLLPKLISGEVRVKDVERFA